MDLLLQNKVVLVTGSSRGLGKSIVQGFLGEGARVVVTGLKSESVEKTTKEFLKSFPADRILHYFGDFFKEESIRECVNVALRTFGRIDILVANLGSGTGSPDWSVSDEEWESVWNLNFNTARKTIGIVVPEMIRNKSGSVVIVSSIAGKEFIGAPVAYSVAKAALIALSKNTARRLAPYGVRVNAVCPGNIFFEGGTWDKKLKQNRDDVLKMIQENVPMNRFASPEEIANIVVFLSSDRASFMTGSCVVIDGGQTVSI
jgi:3-oxoacyl-[acyl-carrier protein] reductase